MAKFKDLTSEEVGNIIDWYNRGLYSQRELAEIFDTSRATIRRVVKESRPVEEEISPDMGHYEDVGQPNDEDVGHSDMPPAWLAALIMLGFAAWVGGIIYFAL